MQDASYFEDRSIPEPNTGCWLWLRGVSSNGYGTAWDGSRTTLAHRHSYEVFRGEIPEGLWVLHKCDQPICVNPAHLFLGTHQDNEDDKVGKGRARGAGRGQKHWKNKLTVEQVLAIRADPRPQATIAAEYGVGDQAISKIKLRRTWRHLA